MRECLEDSPRHAMYGIFTIIYIHEMVDFYGKLVGKFAIP